MYGRGRGLAEEAAHELGLDHDPEFGNASTQGRADLILLVFALGWVLGPIRELWAVPQFGRIVALLVEAVIMLIAMIASSRWVIRLFNVPQTLGSTIPMGLVALAILAPAEIAGVLWVRGLSLREYLASFVTVPGVISLVMFLVFAAMPTLVGRFTAARFEDDECGRQ